MTGRSTALVVAVVVAACGPARPQSHDVLQRTAPAAVPGTLQAHLAYPDASVRFDPPPSGSKSTIQGGDVERMCGSGVSCESGPPDAVELALFSDDALGDSSSGTIHPEYQNVLAWALTWHHVDCIALGPPGRPTVPPAMANGCDFVSVVDASTGRQLITVRSSPAA